jgi:predicted dithiol-disulfide oxidoreductase (DUF899 family)
MPMLTVFHRDRGRIRHFWSSEMLYAPTEPNQDPHPRHVGTLEPLWNLFDFTREGRPMSWNERIEYRVPMVLFEIRPEIPKIKRQW